MNKLEEWLEERIKEMANDIEYYVSEGIPRKRAIEMVREESAISAMNFKRVVQLVQQGE